MINQENSGEKRTKLKFPDYDAQVMESIRLRQSKTRQPRVVSWGPSLPAPSIVFPINIDGKVLPSKRNLT